MGYPTYLNGNKISGGINYYITSECYSTEEREVGCWIDGRPLYCKAIHFTDGTPDKEISSNSWTAVGVTIANDVCIIKCFGTSDDGTAQGSLLAWNDSGTLKLQTPRNSTGYVVDVILYYIKTSDTAGSGIWTPNGIPAVHYSTDEHIIGTWIDGSTLYEKTLAIPSLSAGSNTINHGISNFGKMIYCEGTINYDGDDLILPYMQTQVTSGYVAYGIGISNFNSTRYFIILGSMFDVSKFSSGYVTVRYTKSAS